MNTPTFGSRVRLGFEMFRTFVFFVWFFPPIIGFCRLAPLAPTLYYDLLDDPTVVT